MTDNAGWKPIETAPGDGRTILAGLYMDDGVFTFDVVQCSPYSFDGMGFGYSRNIAPYTIWHDIAPPPDAP